MMNIDEKLIVRYLQGKCTPEESIVIETWEKQSDENKKVLEQLYLILQVFERVQNMNIASPDEALLKLKKKINHEQRKYTRFYQIFNHLQRVAAILFIPILLFTFFLILQDYNGIQRYVEVKTNAGMRSFFDLPDGTKVWLNSKAKLKYPTKFSSQKREVYLEGQGYFSVKQSKKVPFVVRIDNSYSVEVLGTEFNITAYENDYLVETTLFTGKVKLNIRCADGRFLQKQLKPNEKATYDRKTHRLHITTVNSESDKAWREGKIIFTQHSMEQVLRVLGHYYNVHFVVKDQEVLQSRITGKFMDESLQQVLEYIELASNIKFKTKQLKTIENSAHSINTIEVFK